MDKKNQKTVHGHQVLINYLKKHRTSYPKDTLIIEIGCSRQDRPSDNSTISLSRLAKEYSYRFRTVDVNRQNIEKIRSIFYASGFGYHAIIARVRNI